MPMLGDVLAAARRSSSDFMRWLEARDRDLVGRIAAAADPAGESPTSYVRAAVADFGQYASEDDWATLTSRLRDTDDPGTVCLRTMVEWRLTAEAAARRASVDIKEEDR